MDPSSQGRERSEREDKRREERRRLPLELGKNGCLNQ
jgi:hypothetical protein